MDSKPDKFIPSIIGGVIIGILTTVPGLSVINCFCCAGIVLGGYVAVFIYFKTLGDAALSYSDGALVGLLSGIFGVLFGLMLNSILGITIDEVLDQVMQNIDNLPPEVEDILLMLRENKDQLLILNLAFSILLNGVFGLLGGILGVSILGKKHE